MVADSLIFRKDENGEYNVFFSKQTIKDISLKFFKKGYMKNVNLFHDPNLQTEGVTIFESFISDKERGVHPMKGFEDLPDGSWFISAKVENDEVWNRIKAGELKGFSVEGIFSYVKMAENGTERTNPTFNEKSIMTELQEIWNSFKAKFMGEIPGAAPVPDATQALAEYKLKDGTSVTCDKLEAGGKMMQGNVPAPAGVYEFEDGTMVTVADGGMIAEIQPSVAAAPTDYSKQFAAYDEKFTSYEQKFNEVSTSLEGFRQQFAKTNETIVALMKVVEKIVDIPTANPSEKQNHGFQSEKERTKEERRTDLAKLLTNLKTKQ